MTAPSWQTVGIIFATLASLGPIADRFLLARHRERLHDRFTDWWIKLDDTRIPNLPLRMAQMTVGTLDRVFGKKSLSLSSLSTSAILSVLFTAMAITVSSYAFLGSDYYRSAIDERGEWIAFNTFRVFMNERIRNWPIYVFNIPFDIISVLVSVKLLSVASRCAPGKSALIIVLDVAIAFLLAASSSTLIASWYMRSTCVGACTRILCVRSLVFVLCRSYLGQSTVCINRSWVWDYLQQYFPQGQHTVPRTGGRKCRLQVVFP